jgi:hypothetical protein
MKVYRFGMCFYEPFELLLIQRIAPNCVVANGLNAAVGIGTVFRKGTNEPTKREPVYDRASVRFVSEALRLASADRQ